MTIFDRIHIPVTDSLVYTQADEGRFLLLRKDIGISRTILTTGSWAVDDVALFRKIVKPGQTVLDIGANLGHHSVVFSRLVGPAGRVYSFEPQNIMLQLLGANLALNGCSNARALPMALGEFDGRTRMLPLDYEQENNFGALGLSVHPGWSTGQPIRIARLDTILEEEEIGPVDFVKIDVQTFELFVLRGATRFLADQSPLLFVEIAPFWTQRMNGYDAREIYHLLVKLGYRLYDKQFQPIDPGAAMTVEENTEWDILASKTPLNPIL